MDFRLEQRFAVPLAVVEAALLDPDFAAGLATRPQLLSEERDGTLLRRRVRHVFTGQLSPAVTAVVDPAKLTWVDVGEHDLARHRSRHHIEPDHYRSRLTCEYETVLSEDGDGTVRLVVGRLRVHMPLVGGRVERAVVSGLADHAEREEASLAAWLAS
ncbi:MAG TPA: DUF2505 family protein [Acidimicrobiales bacterium]|nr:DUF2505 family protein [Acidimicrobiales bacterium]